MLTKLRDVCNMRRERVSLFTVASRRECDVKGYRAGVNRKNECGTSRDVSEDLVFGQLKSIAHGQRTL